MNAVTTSAEKPSPLGVLLRDARLLPTYHLQPLYIDLDCSSLATGTGIWPIQGPSENGIAIRGSSINEGYQVGS